MKYILLFFSFFNIIYGQNSDCMNAIQICSNANLNTNPIGSGTTDIVNYGCLGGESSSAWYILNISTNGILTFTINPSGNTDYDFALWGPFNSINCNTLGTPIRCSYADPSDCTTNSRFNTGIRTTDSDLSENGSSICFATNTNILTGIVNGFTNSVNVFGGEKYMLLINNYDNNSRSFTLSFPSMTAQLSCPTLPIIFNYIDGYAINDTNYINISILQNIDIQYINIYRLNNSWDIIYKTVSNISDFIIKDNPKYNNTLYKVETVNFDGIIETSNIIEISNNNTNILLNPNPVQDILQLSNKNVNYEIYTITGSLITNGNGIEVSLKSYQSGLYFIKIDGEFYKIVKE